MFGIAEGTRAAWAQWEVQQYVKRNMSPTVAAAVVRTLPLLTSDTWFHVDFDHTALFTVRR